MRVAFLVIRKDKGEYEKHLFFHSLMIVLFRLFLKKAFIRRRKFSIKSNSSTDLLEW